MRTILGVILCLVAVTAAAQWPFKKKPEPEPYRAINVEAYMADQKEAVFCIAGAEHRRWDYQAGKINATELADIEKESAKCVDDLAAKYSEKENFKATAQATYERNRPALYAQYQRMSQPPRPGEGFTIDELDARAKAAQQPAPKPAAKAPTATPKKPPAVKPVYRPTPPQPVPRKTPEIQSGPFWLLLVGGSIGLFLLFLVGIGKSEPVEEGPPLSDNYGSATFADHPKTLEPTDAASHGLFLGKRAPGPGTTRPKSSPFLPAYTGPQSHTLIVAQTRTGKGTRVIIPTLLRYTGSLLAIDPKGENALVTASTRKDQFGQRVRVINPWSVKSADFVQRGFPRMDSFNPLDALDPKNPNAVNTAQALAATICPTVDSSQAYWTGNAASLIAAILLWLAYQPGEQKTLGRARHLLTLSRREFTQDYLPKMATCKGYDGAIAEMVRPFEDLDERPYSGIFSTATEATRFLSDPQIKRATAESTFSMDEMVKGQGSLYLVIPLENITTHRTWLRLMISTAMQAFKRSEASQRKGRCLFLIDEFANLGAIPDIPKDITSVAGWGVDMALVVQSLGQIKAEYGDANASSIIGNCAWKWFCNVNDLETAKYVSDSLGSLTVRTKSKTKTKGQSANERGGTETESESTAWGETGRPLLMPAEIMNLGRNAAIAFQPGGPPLFLEPFDYWDLTTAFSAFKDKYPALYWNPPLRYEANPYHEQSRENPGGGEQRSRGTPRMTPEEAREVLGVGPNATPDEIRKAYKRLMAKLHPDKGGSNHLAKLLNQARKVLLGE